MHPSRQKLRYAIYALYTDKKIQSKNNKIVEIPIKGSTRELSPPTDLKVKRVRNKITFSWPREASARTIRYILYKKLDGQKRYRKVLEAPSVKRVIQDNIPVRGEGELLYYIKKVDTQLKQSLNSRIYRIKFSDKK